MGHVFLVFSSFITSNSYSLSFPSSLWFLAFRVERPDWLWLFVTAPVGCQRQLLWWHLDKELIYEIADSRISLVIISLIYFCQTCLFLPYVTGLSSLLFLAIQAILVIDSFLWSGLQVKTKHLLTTSISYVSPLLQHIFWKGQIEGERFCEWVDV